MGRGLQSEDVHHVVHEQYLSAPPPPFTVNHPVLVMVATQMKATDIKAVVKIEGKYLLDHTVR